MRRSAEKSKISFFTLSPSEFAGGPESVRARSMHPVAKRTESIFGSNQERTVLRCLIAILILGIGVVEGSNSLKAQSLATAKPTVVLVRPSVWAESLAEWKAYRSSEYRFVEVDSLASSAQLRERIAGAIKQAGSPAVAILLCGDAAIQVAPNQWRALIPGVVQQTQIQLGDLTTKELCTDAPYGDLDQDGCPDIAIGRLPAKTPEELKRMLRRSIDYEAIPPGPWNDTVHVTAGVGGFGFLADTAIETVTRRFLTEGIPPYFRMNVTVASCTSTYCPDPFKLRDAYINRINQGGLFWVYIGHGQVDELDHYPVDRNWLPIGQPADASKFVCKNRPPIALMLACFTGAYDARVDCFSEHLLAQPEGPIAVISGSRVTMPYGLSQLSSELLNGCFRDRIPTLGELLLQAKRRVWVDDESSFDEPNHSTKDDLGDAQFAEIDIRKRYRKIITEMAQALNPGEHDLTLERREHVRLMNLLGDPLLKLPYPTPLDLAVPGKAISGQRLKVSGHSKIAGKLIVELALVRDRVPEGVAAVRNYRGTQEDHDRMENNYRSCNELMVDRHVRLIEPGDFEVELKIPDGCTGRHVVSAYVYGDQTWSAGSQKIVIRKP